LVMDHTFSTSFNVLALYLLSNGIELSLISLVN
jgi:hypothetical protein